MPEAVVDRLEAVDVQEGHRHQLARPRGAPQCHIQPVVEQATVRQPGQLVMGGLEQHLVAVRLLQGHVAHGGDPDAARAAEQAHRHLRRKAVAIAADPDHLGAGIGCGCRGQLALGLQKLVDVTADHGHDVAAEDRGCGRVGDLHARRRVQHHDAFAHGFHDRPQLLLTLLQGELPRLGLGDVGVDADHAAVRQARLADPKPAPVAQARTP